MQHLGPERAPPLSPRSQILDRELSVSPRPPGTAQSRAGYANTDLILAVPSLSSTCICARALSPSVPPQPLALHPLHPLPGRHRDLPGPVALHHLCCTMTPVQSFSGCLSPLPTTDLNQIYLLPFSLFAFNIFMCFARSCHYSLVCFSPSSSSAIPSCCCWKIKGGQ